VKTVYLKICNRRGLHARAAAKFVELAAQFESDITVSKDSHTVTGNSILGLMMLAAALGETIRVTAAGGDEVSAITAISILVENKFEES
tara:strand:- start:107 stop:373 length:267 start_codon:yes stop_codon:yes gene_type:complete